MQLDVIRLRALRARAQALNDRFLEDLGPFLKANGTFARLPDGKDANDVSVTTTCTCLMAAVLTGDLDRLYAKPAAENAKAAFEQIAHAEWCSSGLSADNNFTRLLVLRAAGLLKSGSLLTVTDIGNIRHNSQLLLDIAGQMVAEVPDSFRVAGSPPRSALGYWFLDAIERLRIEPEPERWKRLADWASEEFNRQLSYVVANHDALLDPAAMIMAACIVKRLHEVHVRRGLQVDIASRLAPVVELRYSVSELFRFQGQSGIWPKYFPLFHYERAGSNYCFTFEFLEALLNEFGDPDSKLLEIGSVLPGLERAVDWCEQNRTVFRKDTGYTGWNSGAEIDMMRAGIPESWATATVHMFLAKLCQVLSEAIDHSLVARYREPRHAVVAWADLIDVHIRLEPYQTTFKKIAQHEIIDNLKRQDRRSFRRTQIMGRSSALLFGPPGTSKTTFVRALAGELSWPYIEINPSHFLGQGMDQIYARSNEIFVDLMDLSGVVVLFDEMDALVQSRTGKTGDERLDAVRELLTTSMLPKLSALHDRKQIVYFMTTNHRKHLDPAISRPGRFDMLLHIPPPTWDEKLAHLRLLHGGDATDIDSSEKLLREWTAGSSPLPDLLNRFTFSEVRNLFEHLRRTKASKTLSEALTAAGQGDFSDIVRKWVVDKIVLHDDGEEWKDFGDDQKRSSLQ